MDKQPIKLIDEAAEIRAVRARFPAFYAVATVLPWTPLQLPVLAFC